MKIQPPSRNRAWPGAVLALAPTVFVVIGGSFAAAPAEATPVCGEWTFVSGPSPSSSSLYDADAVSQDDVWAVGEAENVARTLAVHWNGSGWSEVPTPSPSSTYNDLTGVAALAGDDAWAVGTYNPAGGASQTLVLHWDGSAWSIAPSPFVTGGSAFFAVSPLSPSDLWAAGSKAVGAPGPDEGPLVARWDGSNWNVLDTPYIGNRINRLFAVDARTSSDVWAVGTWKDVGSPFHILIMHWNGSSWTIMTPPDPGLNDELNGVEAIAADDVWAVGDRYDATEGPQPLIMHWDGVSWSQYPLPVFPGGFITLSAVESVAAADIWASGTQATDAGTPRPLLMHWDGAGWSVVTAAPTGGDSEQFRGLAVASACDVWAVGSYRNGVTTLLTERLLPSGSAVEASPAPDPELAGAPTVRPNPSAGSTMISFVLTRGGAARAGVYDVHGRRVRALLERVVPPGRIDLVWDGLDERGGRVPPGIFFVTVTTAGESKVARVVVR